MNIQDHSKPTARPAVNRRPLQWLGVSVQLLLVGTAMAVAIVGLALFMRAAARPAPSTPPSTIENVNWRDPQSSVYCVACHRQVAPALVGLDVRRSHSQNVPLNAAQVQAVARMGTIAGLGDTLICMSCHKLGAIGSYMLADSLEGSRLCMNCHSGHNAQGTPHDLRQSAPTEKNRFGVTAADGGPCSACHMAHSHAREIISSPLDPDGFCITCHQEFGVAAGHARNRMLHPESQCLQCHNPHDASFGDFLIEPINDLCASCHAGFEKGAVAGMHPIGRMEYEVPGELVTAGAVINGDSHDLTCVTCHGVHTSSADALLITERNSNRLCLACHRDELACLSGTGDLPKHGQSPIMDATQAAVVADWNGVAGPQRELLCVSCHRIHNAPARAALLAFGQATANTCLSCHQNQASVLGSAHDLSLGHADSTNLLGQTPGAGGVCSACHTAHRFPRERVATAADPSGQCVSCHRTGESGGAKLVSGMQHPDTKCTDCHDPHARGIAGMLVKNEVDLCATCHADQARLVGGPHDPKTCPDSPRWAESPRTAQACLPCHVPHGGTRPDLFRLGGETVSTNHDEVCLTCHRDAGWGAASSVAAIHPHEVSPEQQKVARALVPKDDRGNLRMGCRTCHDPHGGAEPVHLARVATDAETQSLCLNCHEPKKYIEQTGHAAAKLNGHGLATDSCKPCHAMHAPVGDTWGLMLSSRFLPAAGASIGDEVEGRLPCLACHHENGPAPVRAIASHPKVAMTNLYGPEMPGYLPLYTIDGREDAGGQVTCRTCHVSHGRPDLLEQAKASTDNLTPSERHMMRMQVRTFAPPNLCTECHGPDARRKFLFFHDPQQRGNK